MNEMPYQNNNMPSKPYTPSEMTSVRMLYPEIFYKIQPYIMNLLDQMDASGMSSPTQEMIEKMADGIYEDVRRMYPEIAEYAKDYEYKEDEDQNITETFNGRPSFFRRRFRRRGLLRDLIEILLLSEFHHRRRRYY